MSSIETEEDLKINLVKFIIMGAILGAMFSYGVVHIAFFGDRLSGYIFIGGSILGASIIFKLIRSNSSTIQKELDQYLEDGDGSLELKELFKR